jgi:sulfur dioxygenase
MPVEDGMPLQLGSIAVRGLHTPGHTDGHFAYLLGDRVFTGDALLIDGCGRTDFQNGDSATLYRSVTAKLFTLPDDTLVYPAHDYTGRRVSSVAQEKQRNPRLGEGKSMEQFQQIMAALNLPYPKFIDHAVPGNRQCGVCPPELPQELQKYCGQMAQSPQG